MSLLMSCCTRPLAAPRWRFKIDLDRNVLLLLPVLLLALEVLLLLCCCCAVDAASAWGTSSYVPSTTRQRDSPARFEFRGDIGHLGQ